MITIDQQVKAHVATLRKMAEDYNEIGPIDLIDELNLDSEMRERVFDALIDGE